MKKSGSDRVRIAVFKARLSEHLRAVRAGRTLTILDRETPVARLLPYAATWIRPSCFASSSENPAA